MNSSLFDNGLAAEAAHIEAIVQRAAWALGGDPALLHRVVRLRAERGPRVRDAAEGLYRQILGAKVSVADLEREAAASV